MALPSISEFQNRSKAVSNTSNAAAVKAFKRRQLRISRAQLNRQRALVVQPRAQELQYARMLRRMLRRWEAIVRRELEPILEEIAAPEPQKEGERLDANNAVDVVLERLRLLSISEFEPTQLELGIEGVGASVAKANTRQLKKIVGIDFGSIIAPDDLKAFRTTNVNLITKLGQTQIDRLQKVLESAPTLQVKELRKKLDKEFNFGKARADLIARDQVLKLNSQLTKTRQKSAGIAEYIWITSRDERVRDAHGDLDGTRHRWDNPPVSSDRGETNHPGEDYQCRCTASPVIPALDF